MLGLQLDLDLFIEVVEMHRLCLFDHLDIIIINIIFIIFLTESGERAMCAARQLALVRLFHMPAEDDVRVRRIFATVLAVGLRPLHTVNSADCAKDCVAKHAPYDVAGTRLCADERTACPRHWAPRALAVAFLVHLIAVLLFLTLQFQKWINSSHALFGLFTDQAGVEEQAANAEAEAAGVARRDTPNVIRIVLGEGLAALDVRTNRIDLLLEVEDLCSVVLSHTFRAENVQHFVKGVTRIACGVVQAPVN